MYELYLKRDNRYLGEITEAEMQFLRDNLEEESLTDTDYSIARVTLDYLRGAGMPAHLAQLLEGALGDQDEAEIEYRAK